MQGGATGYSCEVNLCDYWDYLQGMIVEAIQSHRAGTPPPLRRLSVFITDRCNLRCNYCGRDADQAQTLDLNLIKASLSAARSEGALFLDVMGLGEPTLLDGLPDLLQTASRLGFVSTLGTNAATPNLQDDEYLSSLIAASPLKVRVSLDSADARVHDRSRGVDTWQKAVNFIHRLVDARSRGEFTGGIFINKVVMASNLLDVPRDLRFFGELGVDDVHLIPIRYEKAEYCSYDLIERFNANLAPLVQEIGDKYNMGWVVENAYLFGREPDEMVRAAHGVYYAPGDASDCFVLKGQLVFDACQRLFACLWHKRAGGQPLREESTLSDLVAARQALQSRNLMQINSDICRNYCTREIVTANNRVQHELDTGTPHGTG